VSKKVVSSYLRGKVKYDLSNWVDVVDIYAPQQQGFTDCGVYTCQYLKWLVNGMAIPQVEKVEHNDAADLRNMMIMELVSGKLRVASQEEDII
jgi:Ulp1 family protease